jgi:hypothetical protein
MSLSPSSSPTAAAGKRQPTFRYARDSFESQLELVEEDSEDEDAFGHAQARLSWHLSSARKGAPAAVKGALRGGGMPVSLWMTLAGLTLFGAVRAYGTDQAAAVVRSHVVARDVGFLLLGSFVAWLAPLRAIGKFMEKIGALRENLWRILPHVPELAPHSLEVLPYVFVLIDNIDSVGLLIDAMMSQKQYIFPHLPRVLAKLELILPHIDVIGPRIKEIAPHTEKLLPHTETLVLYIKELEPYLDDLLPLLEVRGWEEAMPYLDVIAPHVPNIAPHAKRLAPHLDAFLPYLPILCKYLDNLAPNMEQTIEVLDRLLPLLSLLPVADATGIMHSRLAMSILPSFAKALPPCGAGKPPRGAAVLSPLLPAAAEQRPGKRVVSAFEVPSASRGLDGVVLYEVVLNGDRSRSLRYSELRVVHAAVLGEASNYAKMKLLPFPDKTWRSPSDRGIERRRIALENYLERYAEHCAVLADDSPAFRRFVRSFYAEGSGRAMAISITGSSAGDLI